MKPLRLQSRLALAAFLPLLVFGLFGVGVGAYALFRIPERLAVERQVALAQVAATGVAGNLRAEVVALQDAAAQLGSRERATEVFVSQFRSLSAFDVVALLDDQGAAVATLPYGSGALGTSLGGSDFFDQVRQTRAPTFAAGLQLQPTGRPAGLIAVPLSTDGPFRGALVGGFALDRPYWARDLSLLNTPQGGVAYVVDRDGGVVYRADAARLGTAEPDPDLQRLVLAGRAAGTLSRPAGSEAPRVVAYAPIPEVGWGLVVEEPWRVVSASVLPYQYAAGGLMLLGLLLAVIALRWSVRREIRPLAGLVAEGERVARGESFQPLPVEGSADVRTLLAVVNQTMARLVEQRAALRRYALAVLRTQEEERLRVSRDLHDSAVQDLVGLTQRIELCADALERDPGAAPARLEEIGGLARRALREVRQVSHNLRPTILEDLGLAAALRVLTRDLGQELPQARAHCEVVGEEVRLPVELELTAYRIAQEALANVRRHARSATRVSVALVYEERSLTLQVEDDGPGFDVGGAASLVREGHLGLSGMSERARLFGGELSVESIPGEGTTVSLHLPLASSDRE